MFCKSCGESLKAGAKFCGKCGATVEVTALEGIQCPKCGAINRPGAKFCRQDGTPLVDAPVMSQRPSAAPPAAERAASQAAPTVSPVTKGPPPAQPAPPPRPVHAEAVQVPASGSTSRLWLAIGALAVLAAAGGGYWLYKSRGVSPQVAETTPAPELHTPETYAPREQEGDVVEPPAPATSETPSSAQSPVADAPQVSVGDRWVTEVVDHQDAALSYRAERTVTDVGPNRIFTSVRTLGKDYTRVVEYTGEWALVATHLRSGATTSYSPALPYLSFPLQPGKSWQERVMETDAEGQQRVHDVRAQMESWETVQVPAGTFHALKIVLTDDISKDGVVVQQGQDVSWYAPEARRTVRTEESSFDPATGERRRRTISLVEYTTGVAAGASTIAESGASEVRIGGLRDQTLVGGCGCIFGPVTSSGSLASDQVLFFSDTECNAWMNIDGRDVQLRAEGPTRVDPDFPDAKCDEAPAAYFGDGATVRVSRKVTRECPPEPTECEVTGYDVVIAVEHDDHRTTVPAKGQCGC